jgi:hypothetical protein
LAKISVLQRSQPHKVASKDSSNINDLITSNTPNDDDIVGLLGAMRQGGRQSNDLRNIPSLSLPAPPDQPARWRTGFPESFAPPRPCVRRGVLAGREGLSEAPHKGVPYASPFNNAYIVSLIGVGTLCARPRLTTTPMSASVSISRPRSRSTIIDVRIAGARSVQAI